MNDPFFDQPILNSPYNYPGRHWELDEQGQPTQMIIEKRRRADFITPIPKPKKRKSGGEQQGFVFDEGKGLSTDLQQYDQTSVITRLREHVDRWRMIPNPVQWKVTPETARLLQHWRHHPFNSIRPFFCQVEAIEAAIWLTEVAPTEKAGKDFLDHLARANNDANPELFRLALKLATGAGKYLPDFIVQIDDGRGEDDLLHLIVEIKGYRPEDAKEKKSTMETYWVPGVNNLGNYGRWAFAKSCEVYQIESDFEARVEAEVQRMVAAYLSAATA
jgi:hypothetical protein